MSSSSLLQLSHPTAAYVSEAAAAAWGLFKRYPLTVPADELFLLPSPLAFEIYTDLHLPRFIGGSFLFYKFVVCATDSGRARALPTLWTAELSPSSEEDGNVPNLRCPGYITALKQIPHTVASYVISRRINTLVSAAIGHALDPLLLFKKSTKKIVWAPLGWPAKALQYAYFGGLSVWFGGAASATCAADQMKQVIVAAAGASSSSIPKPIIASRLVQSYMFQFFSLITHPLGQSYCYRMVDTGSSSSSSSSSYFLSSKSFDRLGIVSHDATMNFLASIVTDSIDNFLTYCAVPYLLYARRKALLPDGSVPVSLNPCGAYLPQREAFLLALRASTLLFVTGPIAARALGPANTSVELGGLFSLPTAVLAYGFFRITDGFVSRYGLRKLVEWKQRRFAAEELAEIESMLKEGHVETMGDMWELRRRLDTREVKELLRHVIPSEASPITRLRFAAEHVFGSRTAAKKKLRSSTHNAVPSSTSSAAPKALSAATADDEKRRQDEAEEEAHGIPQLFDSEFHNQVIVGTQNLKDIRARKLKQLAHDLTSASTPLTPALVLYLRRTWIFKQRFARITGLVYDSLTWPEVVAVVKTLVSLYASNGLKGAGQISLLFDALHAASMLTALDPERCLRSLYLVESMKASKAIQRIPRPSSGGIVASGMFESIKSVDFGREDSVIAEGVDTCTICLRGLDLESGNVFITKCNHTFHCACLINAVDAAAGRCPLCKTLLAPAEVYEQDVHGDPFPADMLYQPDPADGTIDMPRMIHSETGQEWLHYRLRNNTVPNHSMRVLIPLITMQCYSFQRYTRWRGDHWLAAAENQLKALIFPSHTLPVELRDMLGLGGFTTSSQSTTLAMRTTVSELDAYVREEQRFHEEVMKGFAMTRWPAVDSYILKIFVNSSLFSYFPYSYHRD